MLSEAAPAKVNLFLRVTGRRADGYHLLDSLAVFGPAADRVSAELAPDLALEIEGPFAGALLGGSDNLVLRAARALADANGIVPHARILLHKALPVASGIGGGSADAAATLRLLARLWDVPIADEIAVRLGADVPVCLEGRPARMAGIGEQLAAAPALPDFGLLLVNPLIEISTPAVFRARTGAFSQRAVLPAAWPDAAGMATALHELGNDLEAPAAELCPAVGEVLAWLRRQPGCLLARMSGSGATCFGLFGTVAEAASAGSAAPSEWWSSAR